MVLLPDFIADLLTHHPFVRDKDTKPVPYSRVDWWDHPPGVDVEIKNMLY